MRARVKTWDFLPDSPPPLPSTLRLGWSPLEDDPMIVLTLPVGRRLGAVLAKTCEDKGERGGEYWLDEGMGRLGRVFLVCP